MLCQSLQVSNIKILLYYNSVMKGKNLSSKANTKHSIKKTSSVVIMHSYRNSNLSETLPINYNDSILSIRKYVAQQKKNLRFNNIKTQPAQKDIISSRKFGNQKRKSTQEKTDEKSKKKDELKFKGRRHSDISCTQGNQEKYKLIVVKKAKRSNEKNSLNEQQLENIENRARQVLSKYKNYTEYLQKQVKNYKFKYYSTIKMLKRLSKAQK